MIHETKPNRWSCLATSFAMCFYISTEQFYKLAAHDGSEIIFPHLPEPMCRRGFHPDEAVRIGLALGYTCTPIELAPAIASTDRTQMVPIVYREDNLYEKLTQSRVPLVIEGVCKKSHHAVACQAGIIFDPDGRVYLLNELNMTPYKLWIVTPAQI